MPFERLGGKYMKVGDYVRAKNGEIGKLVNVEVYYVLGQNDKDKYSCVLFNNSYIPCIVSNDFIIKKGNLIDLIQVGDYVNRMLITNIWKDNETGNIEIEFNDKESYLYPKTCNYESKVSKYKIKSIVTKEQFESMEYKL